METVRRHHMILYSLPLKFCQVFILIQLVFGYVLHKHRLQADYANDFENKKNKQGKFINQSKLFIVVNKSRFLEGKTKVGEFMNGTITPTQKNKLLASRKL